MPVFRRLLGFLRPYRSGVIASFLLAAAAMGAGVLIPKLIGSTVDDIDKGGDSLWWLAGAILAAGLLRLVFSVVRRLVAGRVSLGVEFDLRNLMYRHLQSLELGFFDGQQTGQLMSRATVDLQAVRFFLGYGLIFMASGGADDRDRGGRDDRRQPAARAGGAGADAVGRSGSRRATAGSTGPRRRRSSSGSPS